MWPFSKKANFPGIKRDNQGKLTFELTEGEKHEVQKVFDMLLKSPDGEFYIKEEAADEIQRGMIARGLFNYAIDQIMLSTHASNETKFKEFIHKAIASISKAYSFCPLPIYIYDLAYYMEMDGDSEEAMSTFKYFLELQNSFKPSQIQKILLKGLPRDVDEAIRDAKEKTKLK